MTYYILIFLFGLIVGSFLNSVIFRLGKESFLEGRSYCPHCEHELQWKDLIPLFSFVVLKGECRYCGEKIDWQYPLVELSTGLMFGIVFYLTQGSYFSWVQLPITLFWLIVFSALLVVFVYDLKHYIIPDSVLITVLLVALIWYGAGFFTGYYNLSVLTSKLLSGIGASFPLLMIVLLSKGKWMGMGDVKLSFVMGILLGWPLIVVGMFSAFMIGGIMGTVLLAVGRKKMKSKLAFGPLLILGTFIAWGWGQQILSWYLSIIY
ncbi:MAG: prepilin peptidase [Candidatus Paceibacterota bacterium]